MYPKREHSFQDTLKEIFSSRSITSFFFRYSFTFLITFITVLVKLQVRPLYEGSPYLILLVPVILSTFIGGLMCGITATAIAAVCANYFFSSPTWIIATSSLRIIQGTAFVLEGVVSSILIETVIRGREREYHLRQWYEVTLSSIGDAVIATDPEGFVLYMNPVAEKLTGWKLTKAFGKPLAIIFNIIDEVSRKRANNPVDIVLRNESTVGLTGNTVLISKKGMEIPIDDSAAPIKDVDNQTIGVILVFHDVTQTRNTQRALQLTEERLRLTLQRTNIMAWGQDKRLRYTWIQNMVLNGRRQSNIIGKTDRQIKLLDEENIKKLERVKRESMRALVTRTVEINLGTSEKPAFFEVITQPAINELGGVEGVRCIAIDVTKRKMVEEKKDEFISIASHELRTPLTSIKGYVQILEQMIRKTGDDKAQVCINKTKIYVDKLGELITDLLDVSKIQAGKLMLNMERFDLNELVDQSIENFQMVTTTHRIVKKCSARLPIHGDKTRLEQVFDNLLSNAVKYSPHAKEVIVGVERNGNSATVTVQDFGIGIPLSSRPHLFGRFYRVEHSAHQFAGLGIGLYISQEIIQRHGGRIAVESVENKGSTFSVTLPLAEAVSIPT